MKPKVRVADWASAVLSSLSSVLHQHRKLSYIRLIPAAQRKILSRTDPRAFHGLPNDFIWVDSAVGCNWNLSLRALRQEIWIPLLCGFRLVSMFIPFTAACELRKAVIITVEIPRQRRLKWSAFRTQWPGRDNTVHNAPVRYSPWKRNRTLTFAMSLDQSFEQCVFTFEWESLHLRSSPYMLIDLLASLVLHYLIPFLDLNVPSVYKMPTRNYYLASWALNYTKMIHAVALSHSKSIRMSVRAE